MGRLCYECCSSKKADINTIINEANARGDTLLSTEYIAYNKYLQFKCNNNHIFRATLGNYRKGYGCTVCRETVGEKEIAEILDLLKCPYERYTRQIIRGFELDFYIPSKKLAIEFNGIYWHSTKFKKIAYHQNKVISCLNRGIRLITIFEDEWKTRRQEILNTMHDAINLVPPSSEVSFVDGQYGNVAWYKNNGYSITSIPPQPRKLLAYVVKEQVYDCGKFIARRMN
jgi:very-short-patch-repair endonuclease